LATQPSIHSISLSASHRILKLLEPLNTSPSGEKLYGHIRLNLEQLELGQLESEQAYLNLLDLLLDAAATALPKESPQHVELQLMRLGLVPGLSTEEIKNLEQQIIQIMDGQSDAPGEKNSFLERALQPLASRVNELPGSRAKTSNLFNEVPALTHQSYCNEAEEAHPRPIPQFDLAYQNHLDQTRDSIQNLQNQLGEQIICSMQLNDELATLLKHSKDAMSMTEEKKNLDQIRNAFLNQSDTLIKRQQQLVSQIDHTYNNLHTIESTSQKLDNELAYLHRLSLTDELTELPNRRAILRHMENEVARSRRYDTPLSLAVIDLDHFKRINNKYGQTAGDTVLKYFARDILSVFRHHDTAARYGGEEFAVLMPNTDINGAFRALEKIKYIAKETRCVLDNGEEINMPSFSAGIALYTNEETPEELLNRADMAMHRAKQMGRARIEVQSTDSSNANMLM